LDTCRDRKHWGAVHLPIRVGVTANPDDRLQGTTTADVIRQLKAVTNRNHVVWSAGDDRSDKFHVYLGNATVMARAGKVILSIRAASTELTAGTAEKFHTEAALSCLGLAVGLAGAAPAGMEILTTHCAESMLLAALLFPYVVLIMMRSHRYDLALDLMESWARVDIEGVRAAAAVFFFLQTWAASRLTYAQRQRLKQAGEQMNLPRYDDEQIRKLQSDMAMQFGRVGFYAEAVQLLEFSFAGDSSARELGRGNLVEASRWALALGEHELAEAWMAAIVQNGHEQGEELLILVRSTMMQGRYLEALLLLSREPVGPAISGQARMLGLALLLMVMVGKKATQDRQPGAALSVARSLPEHPSAEETYAAFLAAVELDAASLSTWSLYHSSLLLRCERVIWSPLGVICSPVLAHDDAEFWALAACEMLRSGMLRGVIYCIESAIEICRVEFMSLLHGGYPENEMARAIEMLAERMLAYKDASCTFIVREDAESLGHVKVSSGANTPLVEVAYAYALVAVHDDGGEDPIVIFGTSRTVDTDEMYDLHRRLASEFESYLKRETAVDSPTGE
jgi:hypothetical protein